MRGGQVSGERMGPVVGSEIPDGESIAQASLPMLGGCLFWNISVLLLSACAVWEGISRMIFRIYALH